MVRADLADLDLDRWWQEGRPLSGAKGRGDGVRVVDVREDLKAVVRSYRRGGVLRVVLHERFFHAQRAPQELAVLAALRAAGVPTVEPLAALARRAGPLWRLRLATALVADARPLPAFVAEHPTLRRAAVAAAGATVAKAFEAGLWHRDLHPDNLIARVAPEGVEVLLLDLDRALLVPPLPDARRLGMLVRMARYLIRHQPDLPVAPSRQDTVRFLAGTGLTRGDRRAVIELLIPRLARQVASRRWLWRRRSP